MTDLIIRIFELVIGSLLIIATLMFSNVMDNKFLLLLPLLALPIIFSGMFDWHPAKMLGAGLAKVTTKCSGLSKKRFSFKPAASAH